MSLPHWTFALTVIVILIALELLWNAIAETPASYGDQQKLNHALADVMNVTMQKSSDSGEWQGRSPSGLRVTALSENIICRGFAECDTKQASKYYIFHKRGGRSYAIEAGLWFLRENWKIVSEQNDKRGLEWLRSIYCYNVTVCAWLVLINNPSLIHHL